jgi:enoyl-CoA hydratase
MKRDFETLIVETSNWVCQIELAQPEALNRFTHRLHEELTNALLDVRDKTDIRAVVLGARGKHFSAGGDFALILDQRTRPEERTRMADDARALFMAITECPLPIVAALQGDAIGLGATVALGCDAIVAAKSAHISDPHVVIGLAAGDGGCALWPNAVGLLRAKRYLLTGDKLSAEEAFAMGLITDLVDHPDLALPAAHALATRMALLPPLAVQRTKQALNTHFQEQSRSLFENALAAELDTFFSQDTGEALNAIRERRQGRFQGR